MKQPSDEERRKTRLKLAALEQLQNPLSLGIETPMVEDRRGQPAPRGMLRSPARTWNPHGSRVRLL